MSTDATGAPTPTGIPKYNTSADAPSGLGFNGAMDVIDTLMAARITSPAGIVSGETIVRNGSGGYDRSSVTKLGAASLTGIHAVAANLTVSAANTDIAWASASSSLTLHNITTGGGTLRSFGAPTGGAGARLVLRNAAAASVTLKHLLAGGSGAQLYIRGAADVVMAVGDIYEFAYDGTNWVEVHRDVATAGGVAVGTQLDYAEFGAQVNVSATTEGTATTIVSGSSVAYDGTPVWLEAYLPWVFRGTGMISLIFSDTGTSLGGQASSFQITSTYPAVNLRRKVTPAVGNHTYSVRAWVDAGTGGVGAQGGGPGLTLPGFIRVTKA